MKCGTSALHYYLDLHPDISMSRPKELNFFVGEVVTEGEFWSDPGAALPMRRRYDNHAKGMEWYARHFSSDARVRGESSPIYTAPWNPEAAARLAAAVPEAKLLFMVRDPIERAVSHYHQFRANGLERRALADALQDLRGRYVARSLYHAALERFLAYFPMSRILVIDQADLRHQRHETMRRVYRFVDVDDAFWSPRFERERNRGTERGGRHPVMRRLEQTRLRRIAYRLPDEAKWGIERVASWGRRARAHRPRLNPDTEELLSAYFRDDAERLRGLTGAEFSHWSV